MTNIYERMMFQALGGRKEFRHKRGRENKSVTYVQNLLDEYARSNLNNPILIRITDFAKFMPREK